MRLMGNDTAASEKSFSLGVGTGPLFITTSPLPTGGIGIYYNRLLQITEGTLPYDWSVTSGSLPPGLDLDARNGVIIGVPETAGTYLFSVRVTDSDSLSSEKEFSITINLGLAITANPLPEGWLGNA